MLSPDDMKTRRAYLRPVIGLPIETQEEMAKAAKCGVVYKHREFGKDRDSRELWINSLRDGDKAWVPRLDVLVRPSAELGRTRVSIDLASCLASIAARGATVVDGASGITSRDGQAWTNLVSSTLKRAHMAHRSRKKISATLAKARAARAPRGMRVKWDAPAMAAEKRKAQIIWQSTAFTSDEDARAALPDELQRVGFKTIRDILGGRRVKRKGMGGRPKASGKRR